jgi:hypothetical protein
MLAALRNTIKVVVGICLLLGGLSLGSHDPTGMFLCGLGAAAFLSAAS